MLHRKGTVVDHNAALPPEPAEGGGDAERARRLWQVALGVASSGHDLNNWLTVAISNLEFAQLELGRPVEELELCRSALQGAQALMRNVLMGDAHAESSCDATLAVRGVLRMTRSLWADQPGVSVTAELLPSLRAAMPLHDLQRVLLNLLLNAIDAVEGQGTISMSVAPAGSSVAVEVRNSAVATRARFQGEQVTPFASTKPSGVGLGLPGSEQLAQRAGGRLIIYQHPTGDTAVRLIVPGIAG